ncbi:MAG TPA: ABC transporter ATP-binding protein [Acidimicrobiia bacterium]|nr:ABC transporter ATP-binding protein [Acidimicrobiia bacterium]
MDTRIPDPSDSSRFGLRKLPGTIRAATRLVWSAGRREFLVSSALQVVNGVGIAIQLLLGQRALGALLDPTSTGMSAVAPWAAAIAATAAVLFIASAVQREQQHILGQLVSREVRGQLLDVAIAVDLEAFETPAFFNRLERARNASDQPYNLVSGLSGLIGSAVGVIGVIGALLAIEPLLVPMILLVVVPAWMAASRRGEAFWRRVREMTPNDRERHYLSDLLSARDPAKEVRSFGIAPYLRARYERLYDERIAALRRMARRQLRFSTAANLATGAFLGFTLLLVAWLTTSGNVSVAAAGVAVAGVAVVGARLAGAGWAAGSLSEAALFVDDYQSFVDLIPALQSNRPSGPAASSFRHLEASGLTFTYPSADQPAIRDVSIELRDGEVVALVGENGSGKTTLAKLLAGLYKPQSGVIRWDGLSVADSDPESLRRSVAVIFQDFQHYHLSASDNIGLGRVEAIDDREGVMQAARRVNADGFIAGLSEGYDTRLGPEFEDGVDLSVGQWQRLALARAFFRDAPFVILDEPTAALDPRAENELFERIRDLLSGRTVLLISHRFSSVRSADRIYVLDDGRIVDHGTHQELMDAGGLYAELFTLQARAYQQPTREILREVGVDLSGRLPNDPANTNQ